MLELDDELELLGLLEALVELELVPDDEHDWVELTTGPVTGSEETGVPAGTVKDSFTPPSSVTVITHVSAEATGISATPKTMSTRPIVAIATVSFRLSIRGFSSRPMACAMCTRREHFATSKGRYWLPFCFSTTNRSCAVSLGKCRAKRCVCDGVPSYSIPHRLL